MSGVAFDPTEGDIVTRAHRQQSLPEIDVDGAVGLVAFPAVGLPARDPALRHRVDEVFRVAVERDLARVLQGFETGDGRHDLHAVVRGQAVPGTELLLVRTKPQHDAIPARPRVAQAPAIGVDTDFLLLVVHKTRHCAMLTAWRQLPRRLEIKWVDGSGKRSPRSLPIV